MVRFPVLSEVYRGETVRLEALAYGVKRLLLNRPEVKNAFDARMIGEVLAALSVAAAIEPPEEMRLLLLTGEGPTFCAGADLTYMRTQAGRSEEDNLADAQILGRMFRALATFPAPVIGVIRGAAIAGGFGMAACADFVLAEEDAVFATSEVRLGIVPALISPYIIRKIGPAHAAPMMLSGLRLRAGELIASGLVQRTAPSSELDLEAESVILDFLQAGPHAARRTKSLLLALAPPPDPAITELTVRANAQSRASAEGLDGMRAFMDRKAPGWWPPDR